MGTLAMIGLGSNLGDRKGHLDAAVAALRGSAGVVVRGVSPYHETRPVGGPAGQPPFLNAAAAIETTLDPIALLRTLQAIETDRGRLRAVRWDRRTLDLDLLLFDDLVLDTGPAPGETVSTLRLPHPRLAFRRFVLAPLAEVAPEAVDPLTGRTVSGLLANLDRRPSCVALYDPSAWGPVPPPPGDLAGFLSRRLLHELPSVGLCWDPDERFRPGRQPDRPPGEPALSFDGWFQLLAHELSARRWSVEHLGDRWLVTNTWFDELAALAALLVEPADWPAFRSRFEEARTRTLAPTFVIALGQGADHLRRGQFPDPDRWFPPLGDVPVLDLARLGSDDKETAAAEALAACAASRSL